MIRLALLLVSVILLAAGGEGLYHVALNRVQRVMTCDRFARERPNVAWVRLTNCDIDYVGAGYRDSGGRITELLFPIRPAGLARNVPAVVVVATRDPRALEIAQRTIGSGQQATQESFLVMMLTIVTTLNVSREVEGYARTGLVEVLNARRVVSGLAGPIDRSPVVIDLHARPALLVPALEAAAGVHALVLFVLLQTPRRSRRRAAAGGTV
jgi:hypothetical protein